MMPNVARSCVEKYCYLSKAYLTNQWRFVEDSQNIVGSQRNFVEDRNNVQKFQDTFVEDKANNADARANYEAEARELNTQRQNYYEDARELARRQENFSEDNETMFQFSEKYDSEFRKINSFRAAYDREVDSINRLQSIADLQKAAVHESTLANASKQVEFPVASDIEGSFANEKPMPRVRNAVTITEIDLPNPASTASPDKPWLDSQNLSEATGGTPPLPGQSTPREFAVRPQVSSEPFQVNPQARLVNIVASELAPTKNPPVELEPKHQELAPKPTVPAFDDDSSVSPIQSRPAIAQPISAGQQHSHAEQDVFQIAILLAAQMGNAAPAQASVNRGEIAAMNAGLAGDLKSGFSFLSHTAKKDERRRHEDDDDEEERR